MEITGPRGTNDILPGEVEKWQCIEETARRIFELYGYREIRTPLFEHTEIFSRGIGEGTDIVEKEMYTFEDKGGRSLTLRPEGTASVIRSFLENKVYGQAQPTKWYYLGPMFRYERPQSGRYRQFNQLGAEALGSDDPRLDAEMILMSLHLVTNLGLTDLQVLVNSVGCPDCRQVYVERLREHLAALAPQLCTDCQRRLESNPLRILDCKNEECRPYIEEAPLLADDLCGECERHFAETRGYLELFSVEYTRDPYLVRGLDYYTQTAFEVVSGSLGAQDAVYGGGRYDRLAGEFGGPETPATGFALGIERLLLALERQGTPPQKEEEQGVYVATLGDEAQREGFRILQDLRKAGIKSEMDYTDRSLKGQMKDADRKDAVFTIILGTEELKQGVVTLRHMRSGEQAEIAIEGIEEELANRLEVVR